MATGTITRWRSRWRARLTPVTGFVVDLKWLKAVMEREVLDAWDHRNLNLDVPEFAASETAATIPTTENLAIAAWKRLEPAVTAAGGAQLSRVRVYETPEIFAEYRGPHEQVFVRGVGFRGEA